MKYCLCLLPVFENDFALLSVFFLCIQLRGKKTLSASKSDSSVLLNANAPAVVLTIGFAEKATPFESRRPFP